MMSGVGEMVEFLLACIAEVEARENAPTRMRDEHRGVNVTYGGVNATYGEGNTYVVNGRALSRREFEDQYLEPDPDARVLRRCEADRRIVERATRALRWDRNPEGIPAERVADWAWSTLEDIAAVYADRPGYREEWKS